MPTPPPVKPFPNYKWRWATFQPTESLNSPPIFLGVLRAFNKFENFAPRTAALLDELAMVQAETNSPVDLVRTPDRNLVRNSGQYWKALGLLEEAHGRILITPFGKLLAEGRITQVEFGITIVKTLELPNRLIERATEWDAVHVQLRIKPLQLILDILSTLSSGYGNRYAYLTPFELVKIVIPLAGAKATVATHATAVMEHRQGVIDVTDWPDCAPSSNDRRMAREFLLFLSNYGFCNRVEQEGGNANERYLLASISSTEVVELDALALQTQDLSEVANIIRETQIPANIERKRVSREVLERPYQAVFRRNVLTAFHSTCIVTGVDIDAVLEAAHIKAVKYRGSDLIENGLCFRSDIHQLFDSGHLKIMPSGGLIWSAKAREENNYAALPEHIQIPPFVNVDLLDWRMKYE